MTNLTMTSEARMFSSLDVDANKGRGHVENHAAAQFRCIESATKQRPILFNGAMVRALLDGSKTQTRRVMARQKKHDFTDYTLFGQRGHPADEAECRGGWAQPWVAIENAPDWPDGEDDQCICPYASRRGDRLWVREAWRTVEEADKVPPRDLNAAHRLWFEADAPHQPGFGKYRPGMFMPRWASRITLEITDVRVERLQDISEADAVAEGIEDVTVKVSPRDHEFRFWRRYRDGGLNGYTDSAIASYASLWTEINGQGSWEANPWVWVVEFKRVPTSFAS